MILNRQRRTRVPLATLDAFLLLVLLRLRLPPDSVSIALVTESQIARWNRKYRGKNRSTDVLSFVADEAYFCPSSRARDRRRKQPSYFGDIAIAPAVARRNARQLGRAFPDELRILILHGILHLMGYDHETDSGRMERLERRLRRELGLA
ncbi:MAG: rRNA maturation RNase YbeY [Candidatus Acidiferrales bacterium]